MFALRAVTPGERSLLGASSLCQAWYQVLPQPAWVGLPFLPSEPPLRDKFSSLMVSGESNRCSCVQPVQQNADQPPGERGRWMGLGVPPASAKQLLLLQGTSSQKGTHEPRSSASRCINHSFLWPVSHRALAL